MRTCKVLAALLTKFAQIVVFLFKDKVSSITCLLIVEVLIALVTSSGNHGRSS